MSRSRLLVFAAIVASSAAAVTVATAAPSKVVLTVSPHVVYQGHIVRLHGHAGSCPVGDKVTLLSRAFSAIHEFSSIPAVLTRVKSGGVFSVETRIPLHRNPGLYGIIAGCGGGNLAAAGSVRVLRV